MAVKEHSKELYFLKTDAPVVAYLPPLLSSIFRLTEYYSLLHPNFEHLLSVPLPSLGPDGS